MAQVFTNSFTGGVDRDTAPEKMRPDRMRRLLNFRFLRMGGDNFTCWHVKGNQLAFALTSGHVPLGAVDYQGIAYIFSVNKATGVSEVGTYPSPSVSGTGGFEHVYRPLRNWTGAVDPVLDPDAERLPLDTVMLNFSCDRQMEVEAALSYDGSVDLYFTDWMNPVRGINSGFNAKTGVYNDRLYWSGNLVHSVDLFFETCPHPVFSAVSLGQSGRWPAGNTVFYARYSTGSLDKTSFLAESAPVQVSVSLPSDGITADGDPAETDTGKSVTLALSGIDPTFPFVEIAFAYYGDDTTEVGLIDKVFATVPGSSGLTVTITGFEDVLDLTLDDLVRRKQTADTARSITQMGSILWGANWKESGGRSDLLQDLATSILARPPANDALDTFADNVFRTSGLGAEGYKDYQNTFDKVGYFRGEPYAFGIVFVLNGGKETRMFPVSGYDAWLDPTASVPNANGVLRFPTNMHAGYQYFDGPLPGNIRLMGVTFDTSGITLDPWVSANVCGFYLMRAERKPQLVYQGHVANAFKPDFSPWDTTATAQFADGVDGWSIGSHMVPEFNQGPGYDPELVQIANRSKLGCGGSAEIHYGVQLNGARQGHRFGLFSTDHFFLKEATNGNYWLVIQGRAPLDNYKMTTGYASDDRVPAQLWEQTDFTPGPVTLTQEGATPNYGLCQLYNVAPDEYAATGPTGFTVGFTSRYAEGGGEAQGQGLPMWYYAWHNGSCTEEYGSRSIQQRRYLGVVIDQDGAGTPNLDATLKAASGDVALVNAYKNDPTALDVAGLYQPHSEIYHRISDFLPLSALAMLTGQKFYRGDCFIARTYHRQMASTSDNGGENHNGVYVKYGNMIGALQEMAVNASMRGVDPGSDRTYYPLTGASDPGSFAFEHSGTLESDSYNRGYQQVMGSYGRVGNDINLPARPEQYPNRIMYTGIKVSGDFADAYRQWDLAAYKDFDPRCGEMVKVGVERGQLFTVMESGLQVHFTRERGMVGDGEGNVFVIGEGDTLSDRTRQVSDTVGSQHQFSIVRGSAGHYGYDQRKRVIWRFRGGELQFLDVQKQFKSDVYELSELLSQHSDILHATPDAAVCLGGVTGWVDHRHAEVGWTFLLPDPENALQPFRRTLVFNEETDWYGGERSHHSPFYFTIGNDMYSVDPHKLPLMTGAPWTTEAYLHDVEGQPCTSFYGEDPLSMVEFVVNPAVPAKKVFDALHLSMTPHAPASHQEHTEYQDSIVPVFLSSNVWETPLYKEGAWRVPYLRATAVTAGQDLLVGSAMRGKWMKVRFDWSSDQDVGLVAAETIFRVSKA
jgi:hypothetical protein